MEEYRVKDIMVPLSEYAVVPIGSTLFEAVLALERAQEEFDHTKYKHRGILIADHDNKIVGKLNHLNALSALDPGDDEDYETDELRRFEFSSEFVRNLHKRRRKYKTAPLVDLCEIAATLKVEDFMRVTTEKECIDYDADLSMAIHQLVAEKLYSLLVIQHGVIIGILRLTDVFAAVYHTMIQYTNLSDHP